MTPSEIGNTGLETISANLRPAREGLRGAPVHVVHLIEGLGSGGAERLLHTNLARLDRQRFRGTVITVFPHETHWVEPIRGLGYEVHCLGCPSYRHLPAALLRLIAWLRDRKPALLHTHLWSANVIGRVAGRLTGVPVVSSAHNPEYEAEAVGDGSKVGAPTRWLARALDAWTARLGCDRMIAVSNHVRQSVHRHTGYPLRKIDLVYNPVDLDEIGALPTTTRADVVAGLGLPPESIVLLNVGRLSPQKGLLYAIQALPAIRAAFPEVHLVSAGAMTDSRWLARLRDEIGATGQTDHVHLLGPRRDVSDLLRACHLFVFPSLFEGMGIALAEAMVAGCPCLATTTGPIPEFVRHGLDGWLVPPRDVMALTEATVTLLADSDRRLALGQEASRSACKRFDPNAGAAALTRIYDELGRAPARPDVNPPRGSDRP